jgi:DNA-binding transcriptional regulator YdaS (Cro superfamily)
MHLREYITTNPGAATRLATALRVSPSYLSQMCRGHRPIPVETCVLLEVLTERQVRRWNLKPENWHRIWPELIGTPGAPDVPRQEAAA